MTSLAKQFAAIDTTTELARMVEATLISLKLNDATSIESRYKFALDALRTTHSALERINAKAAEEPAAGERDHADHPVRRAKKKATGPKQ